METSLSIIEMEIYHEIDMKLLSLLTKHDVLVGHINNHQFINLYPYYSQFYKILQKIVHQIDKES